MSGVDLRTGKSLDPIAVVPRLIELLQSVNIEVRKGGDTLTNSPVELQLIIPQDGRVHVVPFSEQYGRSLARRIAEACGVPNPYAESDSEVKP